MGQPQRLKADRLDHAAFVGASLLTVRDTLGKAYRTTVTCSERLVAKTSGCSGVYDGSWLLPHPRQATTEIRALVTSRSILGPACVDDEHPRPK